MDFRKDKSKLNVDLSKGQQVVKQSYQMPGKTGKSNHAYFQYLKDKPQNFGNIPITQEQLIKHNSLQSAWIVLGGIVYDVTQYIQFHPGGKKLLQGCGNTRGQQYFYKYHGWVNWKFLVGKFRLGVFRKSFQENNSLKP